MHHSTAFIIPGYFTSISDIGYQKISHICKTNGHFPLIVDVPWRYGTLNTYLHYVTDFLTTNAGSNNVMIGFSYGALLALMTATTLPLKQLLLCSLAPYFSDDLVFIPHQDIKELGARRYEAIKECHFEHYAKQIDCPTTIFYGSLEQEFVKRRALIAQRSIPTAVMVEVQAVGHNINEDAYIKTIAQHVVKA